MILGFTIVMWVALGIYAIGLLALSRVPRAHDGAGDPDVPRSPDAHRPPHAAEAAAR
jgi:hypothetical protein